MEKSLYQDRVKGELIPEEIKTTPPKKGDQPIPGWLGEKKKLRRRETVQAILGYRFKAGPDAATRVGGRC